MSVSNITSICSLLISVVALAVSVVAAIRTARLATAQTRTELLTKLYYAQVEYEHFNRRIRELKLNPPDPLPPELRVLFDSEAGFKKLEEDTARYRQALLGPQRNRLDCAKQNPASPFGRALMMAARNVPDRCRHVRRHSDVHPFAKKRSLLALHRQYSVSW